jgi:four helix bundle protein
MGKQLLRSATSVAANYRSVCRARSRADFVAKLGVVVEEADETAFWLELLCDSGTMQKDRLQKLNQEAAELLAIFAASQRTVKKPSGTVSKWTNE